MSFPMATTRRDPLLGGPIKSLTSAPDVFGLRPPVTLEESVRLPPATAGARHLSQAVVGMEQPQAGQKNTG